MLRLSLPQLESWDPDKEEYVYLGGQTVELEHSLYTVASWEAKWKEPFSKRKGLTREQLLDYIANHMCQTPDVPNTAWLSLTGDILQQISDYMEDSHTATTISSPKGASKPGRRPEVVTAELLYFYMANFGIPFECEHWHLNRLMTLINVCAVKGSPPRKMGKRDALAQQAALNTARRAKSGSRG